MAELRYVDWDGLVYYDGKIKEFIKDQAEDYLKMGGIVAFEDLPDPSWQNLNCIYKITDKFTSNNRFETPGWVYPAGTWVQCVNIKDEERWLYTIFNEETISNTVDLSDYYTKSEVDDKIEDAIRSIDIPEVNLDNYYTRDEVDKLIPETDTFVTENKLEETLSDYVVESELDQYKQDVIEVESALEEKADKTELQGLASEEFVLKKIAEAELADKEADLEAYYTKSETEAKIKEAVDAIEVPEVPTKVSELENDAGYITDSDLSGNDVYIWEMTTDVLNNPGVSFAVPDDISQFCERYISGEPVILLITDWMNRSAVASLAGHPKSDYNPRTFISAEITTNAYASLNSNDDVLHTIKHSVEFVKGDDSWIVESIPGEYKNIFIPSREYTQSLIDTAISAVPETDLSNYYNKSETENLIAEAVESIEPPTVDLEGYATEQWVNEQGFLKEHQDLSEYAKKSDIPSIEGLATTDELSDVEAKIPTDYLVASDIENKADRSELADLATKEEVAAKANNVLFTTDMRVTTPIGAFVEQESVQNLTITEIITKLLGLTLYVPPVKPEGILEGTPQSAVTIITSETPAHMLTDNGIVAVPYEYRILTIEEGAQDNQLESFLYQIVDESNIAVETGYQIVTEELAEGWVTICIPETVTKFSVKIYDGMAGAWVTPEWQLLPNTEQSLDGYVVYTADPEYDIYESTSLRIVIED